MAGGVRCVECGSEQTQVKDSRPGENMIIRRRECGRCKARFSTQEVPVKTPAKLTKAKVQDMRNIGLTYAEIAKRHNCSTTYVWNLIN